MSNQKPKFNKHIYQDFIDAKNHFESFDAFIYELNQDDDSVAVSLKIYWNLTENATLYFCQGWYNGFELEEPKNDHIK